MLPVAVALASLGGYLLARRSMAPVSAMAAQARRITSESLEARLPNPNPHDEIGQLATMVNDTLSRLEGSFGELRRFTADASHELRTPLTALRAVGEVALRRPENSAGLREALQSMLEEAQRLTELTEALLTLARTESGPMQLQVETLDVAEIARQVTQSLAILAADKEQGLEVEEANVAAMTDRTLLRQALLNIVHNAIRHSPVKSHIDVRIRRGDREAIIEVTDQGPGIAAEHRLKVFDRFFRADSGRSRSDGGFGLGLAIAKASVERCGGKIEVDSEPGRGSTFRLRLPV
jgi:heavy metal sensor kinase